MPKVPTWEQIKCDKTTCNALHLRWVDPTTSQVLMQINEDAFGQYVLSGVSSIRMSFVDLEKAKIAAAGIATQVFGPGDEAEEPAVQAVH